MRRITQSNRFKKDLRRLEKRGFDIPKLLDSIKMLSMELPLPQNHRPHKLIGNYGWYWECHIEPDWLLIYDLNDPETLDLVATGTHADLFR